MTSLADDFNRANSTDLGASWVEVSGDWSIVSNQLSPGSAGGIIILRAATAMASADHFVQVTIAATTAASHGVWARGNTTITQGYLLRNDGTTWTLFNVVGGSFTSIGSYAAAAAPGDVVKLQVVGSNIKAYINGAQQISVTDTAVTTGTNVGIRSESSGSIRFDDFSAGDIASGTTIALGTAAATETAQPLGASKAQVLTAATATEAAQPLTGVKTAALGMASTLESAQPLAGTKTAALGTALEIAAAPSVAGTKASPLSAAAQTETAQPLVGTVSCNLGTAVSTAAAQPLMGAKAVSLLSAAEISAARPLVPAGIDVDIAVTVGAPYSPWAAGSPQPSQWEVGEPW